MSDDAKQKLSLPGSSFEVKDIRYYYNIEYPRRWSLRETFEFWKDYMDMKEKIETYVTPDLSGFDKRIATIMESRMNEEIDLFKEEMSVLKDEVKLIAGINRDMKVDMNKMFVGLRRL